MDKQIIVYRQLLRWRNILLLLPFFCLGLVLISLMAGLSEAQAIAAAGFITLPIAYVVLIIFLSKNNCPWCGSFFFKLNRISINPFQIFKNKCSHCGEPKH